MRKETWIEDLDTFLMSRKDDPFEWGVNDCCLFVADAIRAMTGRDPASDFRGRYTDAETAASAIHDICGGKSTEDAIRYVADKEGWSSLSTVLLAQRGDMVMIDTGLGMAAGVVHLNGKDAVFVSDSGLRRMPVSDCLAAWRVS